MAWNKLKSKTNSSQWKQSEGLQKALQISNALSAMGFQTWNKLEPGDYNCMLVIQSRFYSHTQIYNNNNKHFFHNKGSKNETNWH